MRVSLLTILLGLSLCGCASMQDYQYCLAQKHRADAAWKVNYGRTGHGCSRDYKDGWKQGYFDLSTGQCEEPPPVPPHKYWDAKYQSLDGRAAIEDWYSGWQDGAAAAVQDGTPYFHEIPASPTGAQGIAGAGPQRFHGGGEMPGGIEPGMGPEMGPGMEKLPPTETTHVPHPQVHIGPVLPRFASHAVGTEGELLEESSDAGLEEPEFEEEYAPDESIDYGPDESVGYEISEPTTEGESDDDGYFAAPPDEYENEDSSEPAPVVDASDYQ